MYVHIKSFDTLMLIIEPRDKQCASCILSCMLVFFAFVCNDNILVKFLYFIVNAKTLNHINM